MAKLLLNLRNVPDDEADEVRDMLDAHRIAHYETRPGPWGISAGAIFVKDDEDIVRAKQLMADYQQQRLTRARDAQAAAVRDGTAETFRTQLRNEPARVLLTVLGILAVLALAALPVFLLHG